MQVSSSSYVAFDSSTNTGSANMDVANTIPGNTGTATFQLASTHATLSNTFGQSETGRKGVCLNPSYLIAGVQIFVAFELPKVIPSGAAVETWLNDASGKYSLNAAVRNVNGGLVFSLVIGTDSNSVPVSLSTNTYYVLLISVDASGGFATAQIVNTLNEAQATVDVYVSDDALASALANEPYFVCMSLTSTTARVIRAVKDMAVNVRYYGRQNVGTAGTLKLKGTAGITAGGIAGAVIGSILGCLLLTTIAVVAILVVRYVLSRKVPVTKEHVELKDLENPNNLLPVAPVEQPVAQSHVYDTLPEETNTVVTQEVSPTEVVVTPEDVQVEQEPVVVSPEETQEQEPVSVSPSEEDNLV
jgi:hypothetical protein